MAAQTELARVRAATTAMFWCGEPVRRRETVDEEWGLGFVKSLDPLTVTISSLDRSEDGFEFWTEVQKLDGSHTWSKAAALLGETAGAQAAVDLAIAAVAVFQRRKTGTALVTPQLLELVELGTEAEVATAVEAHAATHKLLSGGKSSACWAQAFRAAGLRVTGLPADWNGRERAQLAGVFTLDPEMPVAAGRPHWVTGVGGHLYFHMGSSRWVLAAHFKPGYETETVVAGALSVATLEVVGGEEDEKEGKEEDEEEAEEEEKEEDEEGGKEEDDLQLALPTGGPAEWADIQGGLQLTVVELTADQVAEAYQATVAAAERQAEQVAGLRLKGLPAGPSWKKFAGVFKVNNAGEGSAAACGRSVTWSTAGGGRLWHHTAGGQWFLGDGPSTAEPQATYCDPTGSSAVPQRGGPGSGIMAAPRRIWAMDRGRAGCGCGLVC